MRSFSDQCQTVISHHASAAHTILLFLPCSNAQLKPFVMLNRIHHQALLEEDPDGYARKILQMTSIA